MSRLLKSAWALALAMLLCGPMAFPQEAMAAAHPHSIVSISVCAPGGGAGSRGSCPSGGLDTAQPVLAPDGNVVNGYGGLATLADEHSTIFPPGALHGNSDYLLFVATRTSLNSVSSGVVVLTGGSGPNASGQWTLDFASSDGYDSYPSGSGQLFLSPVYHDLCPSPVDGDRAHQDQTFDLNYADPGSVVIDPTNQANKGAGSLIMVYEGTNRCVGLLGDNNVQAGNGFYSTIAVATSADYGHTWPSYRYALDQNGLPQYPLPSQNPSVGPEAPLGALGKSVCIGNDCTAAPWPPDKTYGRYAVLAPQVTIGAAMASPATKTGLTSQMGDAVPSAFVDDVAGNPEVYAPDRDGRDDREHETIILR